MMPPISFVATLDFAASLPTSLATTANPRPCSPARAASMVALRASRFVCAAMSSIVATISPISWALTLVYLIVSADAPTAASIDVICCKV